MKYASSIRFGGQLIDAIECDYNDYKRLGLLCPICKDPVFLRSEGTRQQNGKNVKVGAHFCHFKGTDPEKAKVCENRVSGFTEKDIQKAQTKARNQRLKILQRWFWKVFTKNNFRYRFACFTEEEIDKKMQFLFPGNEECVIYIPCDTDKRDRLNQLGYRLVHARDTHIEIIDESIHYLELIFTPNEIIELIRSKKEVFHNSIEGYVDDRGSEIPNIEKREHKKIVHEVVDFLCAPSNKHLLLSVFGWGSIHITHSDASEWFTEQIALGFAPFVVFASEMAQLLFDTNWLEEIATQ